MTVRFSHLADEAVQAHLSVDGCRALGDPYASERARAAALAYLAAIPPGAMRVLRPDDLAGAAPVGIVQAGPYEAGLAWTEALVDGYRRRAQSLTGAGPNGLHPYAAALLDGLSERDEDDFERNAVTVRAEHFVNLPLPEPRSFVGGVRYPRSAAERDEAARRSEERQERVRREQHGPALRLWERVSRGVAEASNTGPLVVRILELHEPVLSDWYPYAECRGCDPGEYAEAAAEWPCSTVEAVMEVLGVEPE